MRKYSLYTVVFFLFFILIAVSFFSIYFFTSQHRDDLIETAIKEKTHLAEIVNETLSSPIWIYRLALVPGMEKAFIEEIGKFKDVIYIRVVNADGTIYKSSIEAEWGEIIRDPDITRVINTGREVVKDQTFQGEKIKVIIYPGYQDKTVWVAFTLKSIEKDIQKMWIRNILVIGGAILVIIIILFILLRRIVDPIRKLTNACEDVRRGNLDVEIKIDSKTELGDLAATFNEMIKDLKESQAALEEAKTVLEIKVRARTKELKELAEKQEEIIKERTKEIQERVAELERFQRLAVGREIKMIELKKEIKKLEEELKKYKIKEGE